MGDAVFVEGVYPKAAGLAADQGADPLVPNAGAHDRVAVIEFVGLFAPEDGIALDIFLGLCGDGHVEFSGPHCPDAGFGRFFSASFSKDA